MNTQQPIAAPYRPDALRESAQSEPTLERSSLPAWRAPVLTRIDIKQTMFNSGSNMDGFGGSSIG